MNEQPQLKPETNSENGINDSMGSFWRTSFVCFVIRAVSVCAQTCHANSTFIKSHQNPRIDKQWNTKLNNSTVFASQHYKKIHACYKQRYVQIGHPLSIKRMTLAEKIDSQFRMGWLASPSRLLTKLEPFDELSSSTSTKNALSEFKAHADRINRFHSNKFH